MVGLAAGVLTTSCWAPQLVRSYRTRSTGDISWAYVAALGSGIILWLSYGTITGDTALIAANVATVLALGSLALLKRHYDRQDAEPARAVSRQSCSTWTARSSTRTPPSSARGGSGRTSSTSTTPRSSRSCTGARRTRRSVAVAPTLSEPEISAAAQRQLELQYDDVGDVTLARGARELLQRLASDRPAVGRRDERRLPPRPRAARRGGRPAAGARHRRRRRRPASRTRKASSSQLAVSGVPIERCLVVEDSPPGAEAGRRAGAIVAGLRGLPADVPVDDLAEVAALLPAAA